MPNVSIPNGIDLVLVYYFTFFVAFFCSKGGNIKTNNWRRVLFGLQLDERGSTDEVYLSTDPTENHSFMMDFADPLDDTPPAVVYLDDGFHVCNLGQKACFGT